jgi:hypothetical protein
MLVMNVLCKKLRLKIQKSRDSLDIFLKKIFLKRKKCHRAIKTKKISMTHFFLKNYYSYLNSYDSI